MKEDVVVENSIQKRIGKLNIHLTDALDVEADIIGVESFEKDSGSTGTSAILTNIEIGLDAALVKAQKVLEVLHQIGKRL
jgi:hypothetical protein